MKLTERDSLAVRKTLHEIASELSQIGGYCDKWTKEYIEQTINLIGARTMRQMTYVDVLLLDWWAVRINGIIVDYTKTPFRLSQLKHFLDVISKGLDKIPSRK